MSDYENRVQDRMRDAWHYYPLASAILSRYFEIPERTIEIQDNRFRVPGRGEVQIHVRTHVADRWLWENKRRWDFTFRSLNKWPRTQMDKILAGEGDYYFYAIAGPPPLYSFRNWELLDLHRLREAIYEGVVSPKEEHDNTDGATSLLVFDLRMCQLAQLDLDSPIILMASDGNLLSTRQLIRRQELKLDSKENAA